MTMRETPAGTYADPVVGSSRQTLERLSVAYVEGRSTRLALSAFLIARGLRRERAYSTGDLAHAVGLFLGAPVRVPARQKELHDAIRKLSLAGLDAFEDLVATGGSRETVVTILDAERMQRFGLLSQDWAFRNLNGALVVHAPLRTATVSA